MGWLLFGDVDLDRSNTVWQTTEFQTNAANATDVVDRCRGLTIFGCSVFMVHSFCLVGHGTNPLPGLIHIPFSRRLVRFGGICGLV